jgi:Antirestriction protein (ArdA)
MEAKIYVGTYGKYNAGNLFGKWLDLTQYSDKKVFVKACKKLHKGKHDPELRRYFTRYAQRLDRGEPPIRHRI